MSGLRSRSRWSNLPLRNLFLPLVNRLTFDLAKVGQARRDVLAGRPLELPLNKAQKLSGVEIIPPSGEKLRLKIENQNDKDKKGDKEDNASPTFRYENTHDIGIYLLRPLDGQILPPTAFAVNFDPDEAQPEKIERRELQELLGGGPILFAENPDDLSDTFTGLGEGKSLWSLFLGAVLVCLVFETLISNRLSPKQDEHPKNQPSHRMG